MINILNGEYKLLELPNTCEIELDIGCGKGSFLSQLAKRYPDKYFLGLDLLIGRLRKLEKRCQKEGIENIELFQIDAWNLITIALPDECLSRAHVLCPDPWPKNKHRANRLLTSEFISRLACKIKLGGCLHLATDNLPYYEKMTDAAGQLSCLKEDASLLDDISDIKTDFEAGFAEQGIKVRHIAYKVVC
ncbi:MAG: methyltransferase domain-containing protein [Lentisphaeria bacterium]|nr:methyltransferase domain-containing protein [Lentisphaeria bacterium]NQZ67706.1 methyltransferase domain-containing protein [Lentisphaeria bacterium]